MDVLSAPDDPRGEEEARRLLEDASASAAAGDLHAALAALRDAAAPLRELSAVRLALGSLLVRTGAVDEGIDALRAAHRSEPDAVEIAGALGGALLARVHGRGRAHLEGEESQADLEEALAVLRPAAARSRHVAEVHGNFGQALALAGHLDDAVIAFEQALALDPEHRATLFNLAAVLFRRGDRHACLARLEELLALEPDCAPARESRARLVAEEPDPFSAEPAPSRAATTRGPRRGIGPREDG